MRFVIVGGGIAGISCATCLAQLHNPEDEIIVISGSGYVKCVSKWKRVGQFTEFFNVTTAPDILSKQPVSLIFSKVIKFNHNNKEIHLKNGEIIKYDKLCIASGAVPRTPWCSPRHYTLRDTDTVAAFSDKLSSCEKIAIVGNGGIATDLVYEIGSCNIAWIIRDNTISSTWFIPEVEKFLEERLRIGRCRQPLGREQKVCSSLAPIEKDIHGCAPGPDWKEVVTFHGLTKDRNVEIFRNCSVRDVEDYPDHVVLITTTGENIKCDIVLWATGVEPDTKIWTEHNSLKIAEDGGILVDEYMRTSIQDVYACGDVCTPNWSHHSENWKQMRTWTQARQMGDYCGRSMHSSDDSDLELDFCFEVFAHATSLYGYKCIFLGDFKGERHDKWYIRERIIEEDNYVCCIMQDHRVIGATLVGETELEETIENLILNRTNLMHIEDNFLDPSIDIQDFFD